MQAWKSIRRGDASPFGGTIPLRLTLICDSIKVKLGSTLWPCGIAIDFDPDGNQLVEAGKFLPRPPDKHRRRGC